MKKYSCKKHFINNEILKIFGLFLSFYIKEFQVLPIFESFNNAGGLKSIAKAFLGKTEKEINLKSKSVQDEKNML